MIDGRITSDYVTKGGASITGTNTLLYFIYDNSGLPIGFEVSYSYTYPSGVYTYQKNLQGDVIGVVDSNGNQVATYSYDAWGTITSSSGTMADINPIRYKGYYYDSDTGMYYLQSRYYDPALRRFINADDPSLIVGLSRNSVIGANLFTYCGNNGVNDSDPKGYAASNIVGGIVGGVIGALLGYIIANALGLKGWKKWALIGIVTVAGAVLGAVLGPYIAKASKKIISIINSGIRKASNAAFKAARRVNKFSVTSKHLSNAGGRYAKFATTSQSQVRSWISQALKSKNAVFYPNDSKSYYIITNMGKKIGTKGEHSIKVIFDLSGKIWSAYPVK